MKNRFFSPGRKTTAVLLIATAFIAVFIRLYRFGAVPGGFNQDGLMAAVDAKALADYGTDRFGMFHPIHFTAWGFGQMSVLMSYLMVPFIRIFGLSVTTARLPCLICSLAGLVFLWLFSRRCFGDRAALCIFIMGAICPWHIMQSRWALDCNLFPHFLMAGFRFLDLTVSGDYSERKKILFLVISMILFGLSMYCYGVSIYTVPPMLFVSCLILLFKKKISVRLALIAVFAYLLIAWPFILCMIINALGLDTIETPFFTIPYFPSSVRSSDILFFSNDFWGTLKRNFLCSFRIIFQLNSDSLWNMIPGFATLYRFSSIFTIIGFIRLLTMLRKRKDVFLFLIFLLTGIWEGLITSSVNINRFNIIFYPLIILTGLGIFETLTHIRFSWIPVAALYLASFCLFSHTYFTDYARDIASIFMQDFGNAVSSLQDSDAERIFITPDSQYRGSAHVSEILTLYYMDIDAEYFQEKKLSNNEESPEIPYGSRFIYRNVTAADIYPDSNDAYVVTNEELSLFDSEFFVIEPFGKYYAVTRR